MQFFDNKGCLTNNKMYMKLNAVILSMLFVSGVVFAQDTGSVNMQINDSGISVTSDQGSVMIDDNGVSIDALKYAEGDCSINGKSVPCEQMGEMVGGAVSGILGFGLIIMVFGLLVLIAGFIFWIVTLIHALTKPIENKGMWVVVMIFTGAFGSLIYYFVEMRPFNKKVMDAYKNQNHTTSAQVENK